MASLIRNLQVRVSAEEMADLERMAAMQSAPVGSVVRAMIRDYLMKWRKDKMLELQLGVVRWDRR